MHDYNETIEQFIGRIALMETKHLLKMREYGYWYGEPGRYRAFNQKQLALYAELDTREHIGTPKEERQLRAKNKRNAGRKGQK